MPLWNYQKPTEAEQHRAFAGVHLIIAVLFGLMWARDSSRWNFGLLALAFLAVAMIHLWRLRVRFSLRTLLIVTTLIAVGLGLIAWLR